MLRCALSYLLIGVTVEDLVIFTTALLVCLVIYIVGWNNKHNREERATKEEQKQFDKVWVLKSCNTCEETYYFPKDTNEIRELRVQSILLSTKPILFRNKPLCAKCEIITILKKKVKGESNE